ncbi:MAG: glucosylceramidase, partial [Pirellulales bacterium]|nr:glucosylceramidase [Pirellulales bacterium]
GEYYIQIPDPVPRRDYLTGCYIDQMLGQWWALQIDLGWLYPPKHVQSAMSALFRYNFRTDFHGIEQTPRVFCAEYDAGMVQGTWPLGGRPKPIHSILYTEEIMSGFEYCAACLMIESGLMREGFTVLKAAADRYDGRLRTLPSRRKKFDSWGYSGNPFGDDECGKFYARAMAIWSVLITCQGFHYDGPAGLIGFDPLWKPDDHTSFFTTAEGWGLFTQKREDNVQHEILELSYGQLRLRTLSFGIPQGTKLSKLHVTLDGKPLPAKERIEKGRVLITLDTDLTIHAGQTLKVVLSLNP